MEGGEGLSPRGNEFFTVGYLTIDLQTKKIPEGLLAHA